MDYRFCILFVLIKSEWLQFCILFIIIIIILSFEDNDEQNIVLVISTLRYFPHKLSLLLKFVPKSKIDEIHWTKSAALCATSK